MFINVLPFILMFGLGFLYRKSNIFTFEDGRSLSKLVMYVTMPCLTFTSFSQAHFTYNELFTLPVLGLIIPLILFGTSLLVSRKLNLNKSTLPVFLSSATIANLGFFLYPFFEIYYGHEGLSKLIMFDIGNNISTNTLAHFIVLKYGIEKKRSLSHDILNLLNFPPLWGIVFGAFYSLCSTSSLFTFPNYLLDVVAKIGSINSLAAMLVLGIYFKWNIKQPKAAAWAIFIRMVCGMGIGASFAWLLHLDGLLKLVVIFAPGMPVGLSIVIYSIRYDLDSEFAVSILSLSLLLGLIIVFVFMPKV